jgi:hypothetical protein
MSLIVYINSDCCNYQLNQIDESIRRTYSLDEFRDSIDSKKVSMLHIPYPYEDIFEKLVNKTIEYSDKVIILGSELHETTVAFIKQFNHDKITYFINGMINGIPANLWMDWFITTPYVYKNTSILDQLTPYQVKDKYFDILLGQRRAHRDFIYTNTKHLSSYNIMTYLNSQIAPLQNQAIDSWIWETAGVVLPEYDINHSVAIVKYYGFKVHLSQVIPIFIYNQTAYSVVAETNFDNHYSFFTEKIVKPILAKRLFIVFSGQYYLRNLRKFGFMTFDGIIDERYDEVAEPVERFKLAIAQLEYLINQPQQQILNTIQSITEYNYTVMMNTNWNQLFLNQLITKI